MASPGRPRVLVYVQALPTSVEVDLSGRNSEPNFERCFKNSDFVMAHSSKLAISKALELSGAEVVAVGFTPILREALVQGASSAIPVPLCSDPIDQSASFPQEAQSQILIGECLDGFFTGASFAGVLALRLGFSLEVWDGDSLAEHRPSNVTLVKDNCGRPKMPDIRRIRMAVSHSFTSQGISGKFRVSKKEQRDERKRSSEVLIGNLEEQSVALRKRLRRALGAV
ncbi:MAG TPA: hypothetical protein VFF30_02975 [Nitrososphaerales archaeon]|nr:hypothetical protein [Nitrososphaerales archaeon]